MTSMVFADRATAMGVIADFRANALSEGRCEALRTTTGQYYFAFKSADGKVLAVGARFTTAAESEAAQREALNTAASAPLEEAP